MKLKYEKPIFIAECYVFNESFANDCAYQIDPNTPLLISSQIDLCANPGEDGHQLGGQQGDKGNIVKVNFGGKLPIGSQGFVTLFNDGKARECEYDWAGPGTKVIGYNKATNTRTEFGTFGQAFYGANPTEDSHAPAYKGLTMFS